jgi:hypothetical protein
MAEREIKIEIPQIPEEKREPERPIEPFEKPKISPPLTPAPFPDEVPLPTPISARPAKSPELVHIEKILSEGLEEVYQKMLPEKQQLFKEKGEETASKIDELLKKVVIQAQKILELIKGWLRLIPGVNKFFLEQEAKIKTDKIIAISEKKE